MKGINIFVTGNSSYMFSRNIYLLLLFEIGDIVDSVLLELLYMDGYNRNNKCDHILYFSVII